MRIHVSEIPDEGVCVESTAELGPVYAEPGWSLDSVSLLVGRRERAVVVSGRFGATARLQCSRCLEALVTQVEPVVDLTLVPQPRGRQGEVELSADDLEVDFYEGDVLSQTTEWVYELSDAERAELEEVGRRFVADDPDLRSVTAGQYPLTANAAHLREVSEQLDRGRHSKTRGAKRRTHYKAAIPPLSICPQCREAKPPHHVCPHCGYYKGREVIATEGA